MCMTLFDERLLFEGKIKSKRRFIPKDLATAFDSSRTLTSAWKENKFECICQSHICFVFSSLSQSKIVCKRIMK